VTGIVITSAVVVVVVATTFRGKLCAFFGTVSRGNFTSAHISKFSLKQTTRARAPRFRHVSSLLFPPFGHETSALRPRSLSFLLRATA